MNKFKIGIWLFFLILFFVHHSDASNNKLRSSLNAQIKKLDFKQKNILKKTFVIIDSDNNADYNMITINNIMLSNVIISPKLIQNISDRYFISHYIRNQLLKSWQKYDVDTNSLISAKLFKFNNYDQLIRKNKKKICKVIYYLYSNKYYDLWSKINTQAENILDDKLLGFELKRIIKQLIKEGNEIETVKY